MKSVILGVLKDDSGYFVVVCSPDGEAGYLRFSNEDDVDRACMFYDALHRFLENPNNYSIDKKITFKDKPVILLKTDRITSNDGLSADKAIQVLKKCEMLFLANEESE